MKIIVSTHQGKLYDEEVDYVVVKNSEGEFAILKNHVPVVSIISEGYVKLVRGSAVFYVVVINGMLEFHDNSCNVIAQEAQIGKDYESAKKHLADLRSNRLEVNRKSNSDFTQKERDIVDNLKKAKAGQL